MSIHKTLIVVMSVLSLSIIASLSGCSHHIAAPVKNLSSYTERSSSTLLGPLIDEVPSFHEVTLGETLYSIAFNYGQDFRQLAQINRIDNDFRIYPGQKIYFAMQQNLNEEPYFDAMQLRQSVRLVMGFKNIKEKQDVALISKDEKSQKVDGEKSNVKGKIYNVYKKKEKSTRQEVKKSVIGQLSHNEKANWHWPMKGRIISKFSSKPQGNKGLDIEGELGQPVRASASGRVVYKGEALKGYGKLVIVKHDDDFLSAYAHNSKIHVEENEFVKAGQIIADIGNTGTDKTKLHFEIRYQGKPVNPMKYLPKI